MNTLQLKTYIDQLWNNSVIPTLIDYIKIPNKSPMFDPKWIEHGYMDQAVTLFTQWAKEHALPGMKLEVIREGNRTPLIYIEIPGQKPGNIFLYGHLDKQPEMVGWEEGLGPWKPVLKNDRLYGRGGADDGYAIFAALSSILALHEQNISYPRCVILIEACEESGSTDLPFYIDHLKQKLGDPNLVICLDSGCGNYDQLWSTTSLRGLVGGDLTIEVLTEGIHSGAGGGAVPSAMLVFRQLLSRLEDEITGTILPTALQVEIPQQRIQEAQVAAEVLNDQTDSTFPFQKGVRPITTNPAELILNRTWRAALAVTGSEGMPTMENAGNVVLPRLKFKLSLRTPPTCDTKKAGAAVKEILEKDPPFGAKVQFTLEKEGSGWNAPELHPKLAASINAASKEYFGNNSAFLGEGGSIPFMGMLGKRFPNAQFLITGVLGPHSNAHGPNEFLHIPTAKKISCCVAQVIREMEV